MSFIYCLVLIAIAWVLSALVNGVNDIWFIFGNSPLWLTAIVISSAIAWLVSDP